MNIKWEEPTPQEKKLRKKPVNEQILDVLMERPGEWARVKTARNERAALHQCFHLRDAAKKRDGHWEFTSRKLGNNNGAIYGRFLGDEQFHPDQYFANQGFVVSI